MEDFVESLLQAGAAFAALTAILGFFTLMFRFFSEWENIVLAIRRFFYKPKYVVLPSAEDIVKYSTPEYDGRKLKNDELYEEYLGHIREYKNIVFELHKIRIKILIYLFVATSIVYFSRLIYIISEHKDIETKLIYSTNKVIIIYLMIMSILVLFASYMAIFVEKPPEFRVRLKPILEWLKSSF